MRWIIRAKAALVGIAWLVASTNPAAAASTVVYPVGQWPDDVNNVQAAVNAGGRVLLKAVNRAGVPTAFNFGTPEYLPGRRVILDTPVELIGEQRGSIRTTIQGGLAPVRGFAPVRRAIRNIDFVGNLLRAVGILGSSERLEISGVRIRGVIPLPGQPSGFPYSEAEGIFISGYGTTDVSGAIVLRDNQIDLSDAAADLQWAVQLDTVYSDVQITSNRIRIGQASGNALDSEGVALVRCHGLVRVDENYVDIGVNAYVGINGYGGPDATFKISENVVRVAGPFADAIDMIGVSTGGGSNGGVAHAEISENLVTLQNAGSGINLYGMVTGVTVSENAIVGTAQYAFLAAQYIGADQVTNNRFVDNDVRAFTAAATDVLLDVNTSGNTVTHSCRTYTDLGSGNKVRCGR